MSGKLIATIYFYLISAGSIVLMIVGLFNIVNFIVNSTQFDQYPPQFNQVYNCEDPFNSFSGPYPAKPTLAPGETTPSAQELENAKQLCLKNEAADRKQHRVNDLKNALTFTLVGILLFLIHFPLARKQSK